MQLRLFNDARTKIIVDVNGENYIVKNGCFIVVSCPDNQPVILTLMNKRKNFFIPPHMEDDLSLEGVLLLHASATYKLYLPSGTEHQFSIKSDIIDVDKRVGCVCLYIDDLIIKRNGIYDIPNLKKMCRRAKFWSGYTALLIVGIILILISLTDGQITETAVFIWGSAMTTVGIIGRIVMHVRYKKVLKNQVIQDYFSGYVEENQNI